MKQIRDYRGKRIDNGEWVYGGLVLNKDGEPWIAFVNDQREPNTRDMVFTAVVAETVGQWSGKIDIDGVRLYEGNVVSLWANSFSEKLGECKGEWSCVVVFNEKSARFEYQDQHVPRNVWGMDDTDFNGKAFKKRIVQGT